MYYAGMSKIELLSYSNCLSLHQENFMFVTLDYLFKSDYAVLIEKIRSCIGAWTNQFLSVTGRLQLVKYSVILIYFFFKQGLKIV